MKLKKGAWLAAILALGGISPAHGEIIGFDEKGKPEKEVVPANRIPPAPALSAENEAKTFRLDPRFRIEAAAAEPLVEDPVDMQFDADGRMWVVEMRGFMNTIDAGGEDRRIGRIVVLSSSKGDGRFDRSTVFVDNLVLPRAVMPVADGALVGEPPNLWFMREGPDGKAISRTKVTENFGFGAGWGNGSKVLANDNARMPNSPLWDIDNFIYFAEYTTRLRYAKGTFQVEPSNFRGEWGITQDDTGHLYYNYSTDGLRGDFIPPQYTTRNPDQERARGINMELPPTQFVWPSRVNPGVNRGYEPDVLTKEGRLQTYTAACGPGIYRGGLFPADFAGNCFVCEPAGNLVRRYVFQRPQGRLLVTNPYDRDEFLTSTDERFRPLHAVPGPDGCLYLVDMYRGIIQDNRDMTAYLRKQIEDRELVGPIHLGRIWRIIPNGASPRAMPHLSTASSANLVQDLSDRNGWWRDTAQRLLVERGEASVVPALQALVREGVAPLGRLHALWTLDGLARLDEATAAVALRDPDERVRGAALRVSEKWLRDPASRARMAARLTPLAHDPSPDVRLQLALSLGEAGDPEVDRAMANLIKDAGPDPMLSYAIASGLAHRELPLLESLAADPGWGDLTAGQAQLVRDLANCVAYERQPKNVARLIALVDKENTAWQISLLRGFTAASSYLQSRPVELPGPPAGLAKLRSSAEKTLATLSRQTDVLLTWPGKPGALPPPAPLSAENLARFEQGRALFNGICAGCHQPTGRGMDGLAPPLADSEWVNGSPDRLVRIVLGGLHGLVYVQRKSYWMEMPSWRALSDDQLGDILTYIRRAWGHRADPIASPMVTKIREQTETHPLSWTAEELTKIP